MSDPAFDDFDFITYFDADGHPTRDAKAAVRGTITDEAGNVRREWHLIDGEGRHISAPAAFGRESSPIHRTVIDYDAEGNVEDVIPDQCLLDEADDE